MRVAGGTRSSNEMKSLRKPPSGPVRFFGPMVGHIQSVRLGRKRMGKERRTIPISSRARVRKGR